MTVFLSTLNQMGFLFFLLILGYILARLKAVPDNTAGVLSKLENNAFIPALVLGTFMNNFTTARLTVAGQYFLVGLVMAVIAVPAALVLARCFTKDRYIRNIYTYGLAFSNFGFMGNAVVSALFPDIFMEYLIFVLPLWIFIYMWGVPVLLIPSGGEKKGLLSQLKSFVNPMFACMLLGAVLGLLAVPLPDFVNSAVKTLGDCMSPVAMLLTGMTVAKIDLGATFRKLQLYVISLVRLVAIPLVFLGVLLVVAMPRELAVCGLCSIAMPLGLNTVVIPAAYGQDTSVAAGMALISHLLSCITIPVMFLVFEFIMK